LKHKKLQVFSKKKNQNKQKKYSTNQILRRNNQIPNIFSAQRVKLSHNQQSGVRVVGWEKPRGLSALLNIPLIIFTNILLKTHCQ